MNIPRSLHRIIRKAAMWPLALFILATALPATSYSLPEPQKHEAFLTRIIAQLMTTQHYAHQKLDDEVSVEIFHKYIETLDPNRRFFLRSDIEEFGRERQKIDDFLNHGNLDFAFAVYARLMDRVRQRVEYARERLAEPFDFSINEDITIDRSEAPWAEDVDGLDEIWRKVLKNQVLTYMLMEEKQAKADEEASVPEGNQRPTTDDQAEGGEETDDDKDQDANPVPASETDPLERTLKRQERYLQYLEGNESIDIAELFLNSATHVFDPHSSYMAPATEEDFDINMSLSLQGIGAVLTTEQGYVKIINIVPGGPADKDGELHEGDRIIAVRQEDEEPVDVIDMPLRKVVQLIRGPKGTTVVLTVLGADKGLSGVPTTIDIVRDEVNLEGQEAKSKILSPNFNDGSAKAAGNKAKQPAETAAARDGDFMVLRLPSFYSDFKGRRNGEDDYKSAGQDVKELLEQAEDRELDGVILDLRGNGGGSLEEAIKIAGFFFPSGPVVQVRDSFGKTKVYDDPDESTIYSGPLVVLIDRLSASASEIVAAAIKDHHRGVIVGEASTHGKGTVQTVLELDRFIRSVPGLENQDAGALKFTIAKFYRVNGDSTQLRGVTPDIEFPSFTDHMDLGEAALEHAMDWDRIEKLEIDPQTDIRPYLPLLKDYAEERLDGNPEYKKLIAAVERFAKVKSRKKLPLHKEQRMTLNKEEEEWLEEVRKQTLSRRRQYDTEDDEDDEGVKKKDEGQDKNDDEAGDKDEGRGITEINEDLVLQEALRIISDLAWLKRGSLVAEPARDGKPTDE